MSADSADLYTLFGTTAEEVAQAHSLTVEILDGYHRYGALMVLLNSPNDLLASHLQIDWESVARRFPDWVKIDRSVDMSQFCNYKTSIFIGKRHHIMLFSYL